jgi:hypothetical protein
MLSPIERLPVEVFDIIAANLYLPEYQNLRYASRQLHLLTFATFKHCFSDQTTTLGPSSIDRLVKIASHDHLRHAVKALHIRPLSHFDYQTLKTISRIGIFPPPKRFPRVSGVRDEHIIEEAATYDYVVNDYPKRILNGLVRALRGFTNLKIVRFRARDTNPRGWLASSDADQEFRAKCFQIVLDAFTESEVQLEEFSMAKGKRNMAVYKSANLPHTAFQLSSQSFQALQHCFATLKSLTISVVCADDGSVRVRNWANCISSFIATASNLKSLSLSLDRVTFEPPGHVHGAAVFRSLAASCRIQGLEHFQLINCCIHAEDMVTFINAHRSLQHVILADVRLLSGSWISVWVALKEVVGLRSLRLASVKGEGSHIVSRRRKNGRTKITLDMEKDERPMSGMLDDLIAARDAEVHGFILSNVESVWLEHL